MKILILANFDVGLYKFRRELITAMLKEHEVVISLPYGELVPSLEAMGCRFADTPVDRRGINPITDGKLFVRYLRMLRQEKPDLVITYTIKPNIYGGLACRLLGIPYAVNITGLGTAFQNHGALRHIVVMLYRLALKRARVVFFENRGNMQILLDEKIITSDRCRCLNGAGVNLDHYRFTEYPVCEEPVRFLFIGRVMAEKGIEELFDAMIRLRREGHGCTLDILGHFEEHYEAKIRQGETEGWLNYHGQQMDVRPFIERCHCFVLPSWHEGMANTNLECAAMGRPVITSSIFGCMEAVTENVSGLLCQAKNADSLYSAMKRFLEMSREERESMGRMGRAHMEEVFDKRKVVAETMKGLEL